MTSQRSAIVLLLCSLFIAYCNSLWGAFQFDDYNVIVNYQPVHTWHDWLADLPHGIRPLLKFTYTLNWNLLGLGLLGFHLFNLALHAGSAILIYRLGIDLEKRCDTQDAPSPLLSAAFIAAMLFALHPIQTEAITYVCGRSTSLMALLYLASIYSYHLGTITAGRKMFRFLSPLLFIMAVASKETAVTLPLALLLWERTEKEPAGWREIWRRQCCHWLILAVIGGVIIFHDRYAWLLGVSIKTRPIAENLLTQLNGVSYLLTRLILPHRLNIDPDLPLMNHWSLLLSFEALLLGGTFLLGVLSLRRRPIIGFSLIWFFLQLLPTNSILPRLDIANERQLYLASWGLFLPLGSAFSRIMAGQRSRLLPWSIATLFVILAILTVKRNHAYRSETALWEDTVRLSPNKARGHNNLGYAYLLEGRNREARDAFRNALRLQPGFAKARGNLADAERNLKQEELLRLQGIPWTPTYRGE
jgi:tetratricopeptide (TPR) repeat protein